MGPPIFMCSAHFLQYQFVNFKTISLYYASFQQKGASYKSARQEPFRPVKGAVILCYS